MSTMRVMQISSPGGPLELRARELAQPDADSVLVKILACGICHSDVITKEGHWPGMKYPRIPGHEIAGVIDAIGERVAGWKVGDRVGIGWHGGHCGHCDSCRRGQFVVCQIAPQITGITVDGGYAEYIVAPAAILASIPDALTAEEAAPLMCAGVTTYNSMRNAGARSGDTVAVLGIGGLGHLGVQFAAKMGFNTIAIARGKDKEELARKMGAHHYIDSQAQNPAEQLQKLGGAKLIVATVTNAKAMTDVAGGLAVDGKLLVLGAPSDPLQIPAGLLIGRRASISGWPSGSSIDSQDTLRFSALTGVRSMNEIFPFEKAEAAYNRMMSGDARFRVVIKT